MYAEIKKNTSRINLKVDFSHFKCINTMPRVTFHTCKPTFQLPPPPRKNMWCKYLSIRKGRKEIHMSTKQTKPKAFFIKKRISARSLKVDIFLLYLIIISKYLSIYFEILTTGVFIWGTLYLSLLPLVVRVVLDILELVLALL